MADWQLSGSGLELCNCYPGCGCNFRGFPNSDDGSCLGLGVNVVEEGRYGDVDLSGTTVVWVLAWPGAVHEGNGRGHAFVDCASDEQFDILRRLWRGEEGGEAFEIYNSTLAEPTGVERSRVELTLDGPRSRIVVGDAVRATMAPLLDPVSGEENVVRIVKPEGFDYQDGQVARTEQIDVDASGIAFAYEDTHAACFRFAYAGGGA